MKNRDSCTLRNCLICLSQWMWVNQLLPWFSFSTGSRPVYIFSRQTKLVISCLASYHGVFLRRPISVFPSNSIIIHGLVQSHSTCLVHLSLLLLLLVTMGFCFTGLVFQSYCTRLAPKNKPLEYIEHLTGWMPFLSPSHIATPFVVCNYCLDIVRT